MPHASFRVAAASLVTALAIAVEPAVVSTILFPLGRVDMQRAVDLARWPRSDADRARFHAPYLLAVDSEIVDAWTVEQIEIITEFRRLELMAEEHVRLNDTWARAGLREAEEAMKPWKGLLTVRARLGLRSTMPYVGHVPAVEIRVERAQPRGNPSRTDLYANCAGDNLGCPVVGGIVEQTFEAHAIAQTSARVTIQWGTRELVRVLVDFAALE